MKLLICLQEKEITIRAASTHIGMCYCNLSWILKDFVKEGLITKSKRNRDPKTYISLSQKGKQAVYHLQKIKKIMEEK